MINADISQKLHALCRALGALWAEDTFKVDSYRSSWDRRKAVRTTASLDAAVTPNFKLPVRGTFGVKTETIDRVRSLEDKVRDLLYASFDEPKSFEPETVQQKKLHLIELRQSLAESINADQVLSYRIFDTLGAKTQSFDEMRSPNQRDSIHDDIQLMIRLVLFLSDALGSFSFQFDTRTISDSWDAVARAIEKRMKYLVERTYYDYEVRVYFNGPPIDSDEPIELNELGVGGEQVLIRLRHATDDMLDPLVDHERRGPFQKVNTVLTYNVHILIDTDETQYIRHYVDAANVADEYLGVLRLIRPNEDVGILALEIVRCDEFTPSIRKTLADRHQRDLAPFQARRFDFSPARPVVLSDVDIGTLRDAVHALQNTQKQFRGLKYAIKRFSSSVDRYDPEDAERLLEYAIALESIYLNDQKERGEVSYRLGVRASRFLGDTLAERKQIFSDLTKLYDIRSRVAHGASLADLTVKERGTADYLLDRGALLVAKTVFKLLRLPELDITKRNAVEFWRNIELGDVEVGQTTDCHDGVVETRTGVEA